MTEDDLQRLIDAANERSKVVPFEPWPQEPWTLDDIADEHDRARSGDWTLAQRWHWVDAVAWIALGGPEIMPLLSASRSMFGRKPDADLETVERKCWAVLKTRVDRLSVEDAERQLRAWCRSGLTPVDGSGAPVALPDHRTPWEAMLLAADVQRLAPATAALAECATPIAPRADREAEGMRVAALLDDEGFSVRDVRKPDVADRWDASKGRPLAVTTITGWMAGKPKTGRPKSV